MKWLLCSLFLFCASTANALELSSTSFADGDTLPLKHVFNDWGCTGENISPQLSWSNAPDGTKSFAITVYDPDAPTGSGWWHWVMFNIPSDVTSLPEGATTPNGATESRTDYGSAGYGGACPPEKDAPHRYQFTIHALDTAKIDLDEHAPAAMVGYFLGQHGLAKATITVTYGHD